jgi:hypothetical protein
MLKTFNSLSDMPYFQEEHEMPTKSPQTMPTILLLYCSLLFLEFDHCSVPPLPVSQRRGNLAQPWIVTITLVCAASNGDHRSHHQPGLYQLNGTAKHAGRLSCLSARIQHGPITCRDNRYPHAAVFGILPCQLIIESQSP